METNLRRPKRNQKMNFVYFLQNGQHSYIGCTNNLRKRLKEHKGLKAGGARCTRMWRDHSQTHLIAFIGGFTSRHDALSYEWHAHASPRRCSWFLPNCVTTHPGLCRFLKPLLSPKFAESKVDWIIFLVQHHELQVFLKEKYGVKDVLLVEEP